MAESTGAGRGKLAQVLIAETVEKQLAQLDPESPSQFEDSQDEQSSHRNQSEEFAFDEVPTSSEPDFSSEVEPIEVVTNFIRMKREEGYDVFLYVVEFQPPIEDRRIIRQILESEQTQKRLKVKPFVLGSKFYLPQKVDDFSLYPIPHPEEKVYIRMIVSLIKKVELREQIVLFNCMFKKIMTELNYHFMKTKYFDEKQTINLEEWMMEIWPGYALDVVQDRNELMLLCDISHRVLHKTNVYDHLKLLMPNQRYKQVATRHLLGTSVITKYNKQTYRIDDIDFETNPLSTFKWGDIVVSYAKYFQEHWGLKIKHMDQPLLVHRKYMPKTSSYRLIYLVPELCNMTGLNMIQDRNVFLKIIAHVQPPPNMRYRKLMRYIQLVNEHPNAKDLLKSWGLTLDRASHTTMADKYPEEMLISDEDNENGNGNSFTRHRFLQTRSLPQNWSHLLRHSLLKPAPMGDKWMIVFTRRDKALVDSFIKCCRKYSRTMGIDLQLPRMIIILGSNTDNYLTAIKNNYEDDDKIIVLVTPGNIEIKQRYDALKQFCSIQLGIPTQFLRAATLGQPRKLETICPNILVQMNCKIGGTPWGIQMPLKNVMYVGIDIYHRKNLRKKSVIGFVASMDSIASRWFSKAFVKDQDTSDICDESLIGAMTEALYKYRTFNECLPTFIIIYRDDVGIPVEKLCNIEYSMIMNAIRDVYALDAAVVDGISKGYEYIQRPEDDTDAMPFVVFMTVAKRISVKLFVTDDDTELMGPPSNFDEESVGGVKLINFDDDKKEQKQQNEEDEDGLKVKNVPSGTILTQNTDRFDQFYLVSQKVNKTCACPVRVRVLRNTEGDLARFGGDPKYKPELTTQYLQSLSYKLCYLYFNTASICRQPAPGMYAHKVANFVGEHLEQKANEDLEDKLFFL